jgi:hypothetical protein
MKGNKKFITTFCAIIHDLIILYRASNMINKLETKASFFDQLNNLLWLYYHAIEFYDSAINKLSTQYYKDTLTKFKNSHIQRIGDISALLKKHNKKLNKNPNSKQWLAKSKLILADLSEEKTILLAMMSNETNIVLAYYKLYSSEKMSIDSEFYLMIGLKNQLKHLSWFESMVHALKTGD